MEDIIKLKEDNIYRIKIFNKNNEDTGEELEFDLEDIELPLKLDECSNKHFKNVEYVKLQFAIIDKKEDSKANKYSLSQNEKEKLNVLKEFYKRETEALNLFLGDNGVSKLLGGRKPYYTMYDDINDMLKPILPKLKLNIDDIAKKIKDKYSIKEEENVLE